MKKSNLKKMKHTLKHKIAFLKVERELTGKISTRGLIHDMDKVFMYLFSNMSIDKIRTRHRTRKKHHVENNLDKSKKDFLEMVIDWECARHTKPEKSLNAYDTVMKIHPEVKADILPLLKELSIHP